MTIKKWLPFILILALSSSAFAADKVISPDHTLIALIEPFLRTKGTAAENELKVMGADGTVLAKRDFRSDDKEHGLIIYKIEWTPDSKFLVFSTYSSGGHQPYHAPTFFFPRIDAKIYSLDDLIGPVLDSDFEILSNDMLKVFVKDKKTGKEMQMTIRLSDLIKK